MECGATDVLIGRTEVQQYFNCLSGVGNEAMTDKRIDG